MNTEWERVNQLFHEATECAEEDRAKFIARAVKNDSALRQEVQSLIAAYEEDNGFLENPALGKSLFRKFGGWQRQIIDALRASAGKVSSGTNRMIGQLLDGKYEIEALCGRGGMGAVYRATHVGTGRRVAVKVIAPELAGNSEFIERFRREAKTIGLLRHPNIVNVTDFGVTGAGAQRVAYLVMEYLEGQTLAERLKNGRPSPVNQTNSSSIFEIMYERMKDRRLMPINEAIAILNQTCAAMDEAHRLGILHRDLKPENIWLEPAGPNGSNVKILDFGISRLQDIIAVEDLEAPPEPGEPAIHHQPFSITEAETLRLNYTAQQMSRFGSVMGTPTYMSPEQCRGERLDKSSDVYSLGVIAYQMFTGETPFTGTTPELLVRHREADPAPLREKRRDIPAGVDAVVRQALAKDRNARPATAGAFAFQLQQHSVGNQWVRLQADALNRKYRWKFVEIGLRMQWKGWLLSLLLIFATLKLPGMPSAMSVAVFGLLWLAVAAITILGQNATTAACSLFLEQMEGGAKQAIDLRSIFATVQRRSLDLVQSACRLIIPPLILEELGVKEAREGWATLKAPIRRQTAYTLFRRILAFVLSLSVSQQILVAAAFPLDRGFREFNASEVYLHDMSNSLFFWPPMALIFGIVAFKLSLKSAIEQFVLYLAARKALGAVPLEECALPLPLDSVRQDSETMLPRLWAHWKTYAPACAFIVLIIGFHLSKSPWMADRLKYADAYSVKALHASGVPLPPRSDRSIFVNRWFFQSPALAKYLIQKGMDVNAPIRADRSGTLNSAIGGRDVTSTPLITALSYGSVDIARMFIDHGADVRAQNSSGDTPMLVAVTRYPQAIEMLLAAGVGINEQTRFGPPLIAAVRHQWSFWTPATSNRFGNHMAERFESELANEKGNAVRILIEKGADPNTRDDEGRNGLMLMSMESGNGFNADVTVEAHQTIEPRLRFRRRGKVVELIGETLLNAGCDINAADNKGRTPLMYAVIFERPAVVKLLLKRGANINAKDHDGLDVVDWAMKSGSDQVTELLSTLSSWEGRTISWRQKSETSEDFTIFGPSRPKKLSR
ncbi:MAG TPA: protein kinase [Blastocatellia bacterium]|nr:protein kinase [Blastocatellia bacterium]